MLQVWYWSYLKVLEIIFLDILGQIIHLNTACHGTKGKYGSTVSHSTLAIKGSLCVKKKHCNLIFYIKNIILQVINK